MNAEQFRRLTSLQQVEVIFENGQEIMSRVFVFYSIRLYVLYDFFVEVWYRQTSLKIDRIILLREEDVMDIYEKQIDLPEF